MSLPRTSSTLKSLLLCITLSILLAACHRKSIPQNEFTGKNSKNTTSETGMASYYSDKLNGHSTASGEKYQSSKFTAAHRKLPFGTMVKVTNLKNGKSVMVRINDKGPFVSSRIIDLSGAAAKAINMINDGIVKVTIVYAR